MEVLLRFYQTLSDSCWRHLKLIKFRSASALAVCYAQIGQTRSGLVPFFGQVSANTALIVSAIGGVIVIVGFRLIDTFSQTGG